MKRPPALNRLMNETTAAASSGVRLNMSCIIGDACARMPMPAVTLMKRMPHSRKNCGVRIASFLVTLVDAIIGLILVGGVQPGGVQPGGGNSIRRDPANITTR